MESFNDCKSYAEMGKLLGFTYYNGRVKKEVIKFCELNNLNPELIIEENSKKPNKCLFCGKELEGKNKYSRKFCDSSCAASYNNKGRKHSEETKEKIQDTLKRKFKEGIIIPHNLGKYKENVSALNKAKEKIVKTNDEIYSKFRKCIICGKDFIVSRRKNGSYSKSTTCSKKCHHILISNNGKKVAEKLINEGRHQGWKSRNIISYPESFWINVLNNNNIEFKHNFPLDKYFLDFYIEINGRLIDLEIDGKQHKYEDRHASDILRDKFIKSQNIEVYRIEWNSINTEEGKILMKEKIDNFLNFILN